MSTLRERFVTKAKPRSETVTPAWLGESVEIRGLAVGERNAIVMGATKDGETDSTLLVARLIIETAYDPTSGEKVFGAADQDMLTGMPAVDIDEIGEVALRLNGIGRKLTEQAVAQAEKN